MIAPMGYEHLLDEIEPQIATVTLNRPKVLNALSPAVIGEVSAALSELEADGNVHAAVLTGGPKVFAAGADIQDMADQGAVDQLLRDQTGRWAPLAGFKKPLIAAVNGYALGGGCEVALMCDLIVAGDTARLGQPEVNLGIIPGAGGTQRWPRTAGKHVAMEVMLTGAPVTAQRAYELGIVNKVVPAEMTIEVAKRIARELAAKPPLAEAIKRPERGDAVRFVVLTGSGRAFCSGADVAEMAPGAGMRAPEDVGIGLRSEYMPMLMRLRTMPKPVIAAMNGPAIGIGASFALACDIRIGTPESYILEAFVNIGLAPDGGVSWLLPRLAGTGVAYEMFFTGKPLSAADAHRLGVINRIVPAERLEEEVRDLANQLVAQPRQALAGAKRSGNHALGP